jgi:hypothetical protein
VCKTAHRLGGHWLICQGIDRIQNRIHWGDGAFSDYTLLRFPSAGFRFLDIDQQDSRVKLRDAAYLRWVKAIARGETVPRIVAFLRLKRDRPASELFPDLHCHTEAGEELFSANSLITHTLRTLLSRSWLRYEKGHWQVIAPARETAWWQRSEAVLGLLEREGRLRLELGPGVRPPDTVDFDDFAVSLNLIPVGRQAFPRDLVWRERPRIAFNTAFFLLEHNDFFSFHSALGEPYGLFVQDGVIQRPPLYRRGAIFQRTGGQWQTGTFSLEDVSLALTDGTVLACKSHPLYMATGSCVLPFALNAQAEVTVYTRIYGTASQGCVLGRTPIEGGRVELTIIDQRIVGWKAGGGLDIPQNGFILSFAQGVLAPEALATLRARPMVSYRFMRGEHQDILQALQVGPLLVQGGRSVVTLTCLAEEEFWVDRLGDDGQMQIGVVPTEFPDDVDRTRAGRVGLGVDRQGRLVVVGAPGLERKAKHLEADSHGVTLAELADLLADAGAVEAVNLDGGGSTQVFFLGGLATVAGGRLGQPGVQYERMVPSVGILL